MGLSDPRYAIVLTKDERLRLDETLRRGTAPHREVQRARITLLAADGLGNHAIARSVGCALQTVKTWRKRYAAQRLEALKDRPRTGRPPVYGPRVHAQLKAVACELPAARGLPLSRFSVSDLLAEMRKEMVLPLPSRTTVWRILHEDGLRP